MSFVGDVAKSSPVAAEDIKQRVSAAEVRAANLACCHLPCPVCRASKRKQMLLEGAGEGSGTTCFLLRQKHQVRPREKHPQHLILLLSPL